jgi:hypothetical protein
MWRRLDHPAGAAAGNLTESSPAPMIARRKLKAYSSGQSSISEAGMLLTKHEGETFINQTVYISGQAFVRCKFVACTLVLRETMYHLESCTFERCNWHVDKVLMWGSPESLQEVKSLVTMIEKAQEQQLSAAEAQARGPGAAPSPALAPQK